MPTVAVSHSDVCEIVRIGHAVTLFITVDQMAYLAHQLESAVIKADLEKDLHATIRSER